MTLDQESPAEVPPGDRADNQSDLARPSAGHHRPAFRRRRWLRLTATAAGAGATATIATVLWPNVAAPLGVFIAAGALGVAIFRESR